MGISFIVTVSAQNVEKEVAASAGNTTSNTTHQLTCTIGEPIIGFKSTTVSIDQGFLTGTTNGSALSIEDLVTDQTVKIYPNPVVDFVTVSIKNNTEQIAATVYNISGKQVANYNISAAIETLNLSDLASGTYLVQLHFKSTNTIKTFKILKK